MAFAALPTLDVATGMRKRVSLGAQVIQILALPLRDNRMAGVAVIRLDGLFPVRGLMVAIVTPEATEEFLVAQVIRMSFPVGFHLREEIIVIDLLDRINGGCVAGIA